MVLNFFLLNVSLIQYIVTISGFSYKWVADISHISIKFKIKSVFWSNKLFSFYLSTKCCTFAYSVILNSMNFLSNKSISYFLFSQMIWNIFSGNFEATEKSVKHFDLKILYFPIQRNKIFNHFNLIRLRSIESCIKQQIFFEMTQVDKNQNDGKRPFDNMLTWHIAHRNWIESFYTYKESSIEI